MKNCIFLMFALTVMISAYAQKTPVKTPVKTTTAAVPILKNSNDSVSYVLGEVAAYQLIQQGFGDVKINNAVFLRAVNDILGKKTPLMDDAAANACLNSYMEKITAAKIQPQIDADAKFLAQNKLRPGVKTTASGLQYEVITEGTGIKPTRLDTFVVHYRGTLVDGTEFDASYNRGQPLTYGMSQVIPGWTEGLQLMSVGSKYKFWIPYTIGYGTRGNGKIPGGAALIFELELLDVKKKQ